MPPTKNASERSARVAAARSGILREITLLLLAVMLSSGLATFLILRASQERLIENSIDKVLQKNAEDVSSFFFYISEEKLPEYMQTVLEEGVPKLAVAVLAHELSQSQRKIDEDLKKMAVEKPMGVGLHMIVVIASRDFPVSEPLLFASSDEDLVYNWKIPEDVMENLKSGRPYVFRENGVPELGLEGPHLIVTSRHEDPELGFTAGYVGVKPMGEEIEAIKGFYDRERRNTLLTLGLVVGVSILAVLFVSFFVLNLLIRRRITQPIEQLVRSAERIMEGDLDTPIEVHEGGDFAVLERALREMLESVRRMFDAAMKGE